ncbi:Cytochrome P450 [Corchorus olitorius]|uniref:Cytochrome P450 n=1 Tax=Corchorus olitorius TaxID=93759 RepID=A0A1R3HMR4_9ROSI|nr:Cytochrome P450 [Corchorus olitorius]
MFIQKMLLDGLVSCHDVSLNKFELPSRLSVAAADCLLALTEGLTKKPDINNRSKSLSSHQLSSAATGFDERKVNAANKSFEVVMMEEEFLLWGYLEDLIFLVQRLLAWSRKSRPLHAKGLEHVLKWLQEIKMHYGGLQDEAGSQILKSGALLLSSCWKHYGMLLHLEDYKLTKNYKELLDQYLSGIQICLVADARKGLMQYYTKNHDEEHGKSKDAGIETRKFFLNCLCLLLGRFDGKKFEDIVSEYGNQMSHVLLSQLHCNDDDVIDGVVSIFKAVIFKPNISSGSSVTDTKQIDVVVPLLLQLLDERDGAARAVVMLIAEYCSITADDHCIEEVLNRLASGTSIQRRNAFDVISNIIQISTDTEHTVSHSTWQNIANNLLLCLGDEEIAIREGTSNLLPLIDPAFVLPALVRLVCSSNEKIQPAAGEAFIRLLKHHNKKPEVVCMLLDNLSNLSQGLADAEIGAHVVKGVQLLLLLSAYLNMLIFSSFVTELMLLSLCLIAEIKSLGSNFDCDRVLRLIPEWSKTVQDWKILIGPLIDKLFTEPSNATIVRFLSHINEQLAEAADLVLHRVVLQMKGQNEIDGVFSKWEMRTCASDDSEKMQQFLFERLCPLLIIRLLPLRVFDDLNSSVMYGQLHNQVAVNEYNDAISSRDEMSVATFLLNRAFSKFEFEDVRKLAAELCGRIHPQVLLPIACSQLEQAADSRDLLTIKACLFSVCTSLVVRRKESLIYPFILEIRRTIEVILLWPSSDDDDVSKAQHGCIDCLALMICAELQAPELFKDLTSLRSNIVEKKGGASLRPHILGLVVHWLINDYGEVIPVSNLHDENCITEAPIPISFRLCMANVLISACQKISDRGKKTFAKTILPCLIDSVEVIMDPEVRAACIQVLFSAVYHLKSAVLPYSRDLLKLSLNFLGKGSEKERMAGAKLMASLMAGEDSILESISAGPLEARSVLSDISLTDPSFDIQQICRQKLSNYRSGARYPPSPPALPLVGHLHLLLSSTTSFPKKLHSLATNYGPLLQLHLGASPCILVSSAKYAKEILKTQELNYVDRPEFSYPDYNIYHGSDFILAPYGTYWRFLKKLCMTRLLSNSTLHQFTEIREQEIMRLLEYLVKVSEGTEFCDLGARLTTMMNNVICRMAMSTRPWENAEEAQKIKKLIEELAVVGGKLSAGEILGPLGKFDLLCYGGKLRNALEKFDQLVEDIMKKHEEDSGRQGKDLMDIIMETCNETQLLKSSLDIKAFFLVYMKLRQEILSVVGSNRLVKESDVQNLPYLQACVKESLRLHPPSVLFLRQGMEACTIEGYNLKAKSRIIFNLHSLMRDPNSWENPNEFIPERFMGNSNNLNANKELMEMKGQNFDYLPFGTGRRVCPGALLALAMTHSTIGALVQFFDWKIKGGDKVDLREAPGFAATLAMASPFVCYPVTQCNPFKQG